jgi:hypothetical protein
MAPLYVTSTKGIVLTIAALNAYADIIFSDLQLSDGLAQNPNFK